MAIGGAVLAVAGTLYSAKQGSDAASAARERNRVATASQQNQDTAALRRQARQARIQRARMLAASESIGAGGSSAQTGGVASLAQQSASGAANIASQQHTAGVIGGLNQDIAGSQQRAGYGQVVSGIGNQVFQAKGGFDNLFRNG